MIINRDLHTVTESELAATREELRTARLRALDSIGALDVRFGNDGNTYAYENGSYTDITSWWGSKRS